jgi:cytochrome c biogenesis protein
LDKTAVKRQSSTGIAGVIGWLWRLFSSVKLALILILIITGLALIGAFATGIDIFHSWWFLLPGALLMLNILVCSLNRWNSIKLSIRGGDIKQNDSFFNAAGKSQAAISAIPLSAGETSDTAIRYFRRQGYRVRSEIEGGRVYIAADKNRYFRLATYASHLSLVIFVLAYIIGNTLGFQITGFAVAEGNIKDIGNNTGLTIKLLSFSDEYYADNTPKDYRSQVVIYNDGAEVSQATVRVNHPLTYNGIRIYQSGFGPSADITIRDSSGKQLLAGNIPLENYLQDSYSEARLDLPGTGDTIRLIDSLNAEDSMIPQGSLAVGIINNGEQVALDLIEKGTPKVINDLEFTYNGESQYSVFQISRDPGNLLIWIASTLFILGTILVLYFPYRQVWLMGQSQSPGKSRLLLRLVTQRGFSGTTELKKMASDLEKKVK